MVNGRRPGWLMLLLATIVLAAVAASGGRAMARAGDRVAPAACARGESQAAGQRTQHAGLIVVFPDGRSEQMCIAFEEETITGVEVLRRSGLTVVFSGFGGLGSAVCRIGDTGCTNPGDCFCQCRGGTCTFWRYFAFEDGEWSFLPIGPSQRRLHDGDVDAWVWSSERAPPEATLGAGVCENATPTPPAPTNAPTASAAPLEAKPTAGREATREPAEVTSTPRGGGPGPRETPVASLARQVAGRDERSADGVAGEQAARPVADDGGGVPIGLVAFGAVAAVLGIAISGFVFRRRRHG